MTSEALPAVQLLGVSGSYNCPPMHSSSVVCLEGLTLMQKNALHSNVVARMLADVLGTCGAQMKLGANDTGRLFNWHPVRFACASLFWSVYLCGFVTCCTALPAEQLLCATGAYGAGVPGLHGGGDDPQQTLCSHSVQ